MKTTINLVAQALRDHAAKHGYNPATIIVRDNQVMWEEGPFEWAPSLLGGCSMYWGEFPETMGVPEIDLNAIAKPRGFYLECQNSFTVSVWRL